MKVWDCTRLEKNVTNRSRSTFKVGMRNVVGIMSLYVNMRIQLLSDGTITAMTFCEGSHSVALASSSGKIDIVRVEYTSSSSSSNMPRYGRNQLLQTVHAGEDHVNSVLHYAEGMLFRKKRYMVHLGTRCILLLQKPGRC